MAESYTTPHSLPILGTSDLVRSPSGDNLRKQLNALATATNNAITAEGAKYVPAWKASTVYSAGQRVIAPNGDVVSAKADHTSGATYTAANWNASSQDGRLATVEAVAANAAPFWKANTAYAAGQRVISPGGDVVAAKVAFTSGASYSATNWNASTQDGRIAAVESKNATQDTTITEHNQRAVESSTLVGMVPLVYGRELIPLTSFAVDTSTKGLWHFDGSLSDSSGNAKTLTQTAGTPSGSYTLENRFGTRALATGVFENAGADPFISATGANGGAYAVFTAECWVKTSRHTGTKVAVGHNRWFWVGITPTGLATAEVGDLSASVRLTGTTVIAPAAIADAAWHHLAVTLSVSGGNTTISLFVDGKCEHSLPFDGKITGTDAAAKFTVGGLNTVRTFDFSLSTGYIDEVRISNTVRYLNRTGAYPPRPKGLPGGYAEYIGTATPGDKLPFDKWIKVATS